MPEVTVFIPTYNRAAYLGDAIDSVLGQTFTDFELLIIDDGSTDDTDAVFDRYRDDRIRIERNPGNLGSPKTRNRGLDLAKGRFIAMLDSDDVANPERLEQQVAFLNRHPDHALIGSGKRALGSRSSIGSKLRRRPTDPDAVRARLLFRCCIAHSTVMGRTDLLRRHRYNEAFSVSQDFDLFVRLADRHKLANLEAPLVHVRRHAGQVSRQRDLVADRLRVILRRQLEALGLVVSATDLENHLLLARPRSWHRPTADYMAWAERWLQILIAANHRSGRYPAGVFERTLGELWFELCIKAMSSKTGGLHRWLWRSPLASSAWAGLGRRARAALTSRQAA